MHKKRLYVAAVILDNTICGLLIYFTLESAWDTCGTWLTKLMEKHPSNPNP